MAELLTLSEPCSDVEDGLFEFDGVPVKALVLQSMRSSPQIGHFSAELQSGNEAKLEHLRKTLDDKQQATDARLERLTESNAQRLEAVRAMLEQKLQELQRSNEGKLELMRQTVDEKLHATLEQRLGESFKLVSERLELVHKGLGEMQALASGVGDLKRVLALRAYDFSLAVVESIDLVI